MMKKYIGQRLGSILVALWFFLLPFEYIPTVEFHGFTIKTSYLAGILILTWSVFDKKIITRKKFSTSDWLLLLFWLAGAVATTLGIHEARNLIILALWGFMIMLYYCASRLIDYARIEKIILISAAVVSLLGILQFIGGSIGLDTAYIGLRPLYIKSILGFPRIHSVLLEPMYLANFLFIPFFLAIRKSFQQPKTVNKYWWLAILILADIILTQSRGAYLSLLVAIILLVIHWLWRKYYSKIARLMFVGLASIVLASGLILINGPRALIDNFANHAVGQDIPSADSVNYRFDNYRSAYKMFIDKPLLGHGIASFGTLTHRANFTGYDIVLNEYLEILAETGAVGFIAFLGFLAALAYESRRAYRAGNESQRQTILYLGLGLLAVFIQYNFFSTLYIIYIWAFLALLRSQVDNYSNVILKPKA